MELSSVEAFALSKRLHKKFKDLDYERALCQEDDATLSRMELDEVVGALEKITSRLEAQI